MRKSIITITLAMVMIMASTAAFAGIFSTERPPAPFEYDVASSISDEFNKLAMERLETAATGTNRALIITGTLNDCFKHHGYSLDATARKAFEQRDPDFWPNLRKTGMASLLMGVIQNLKSEKARKFMLDNEFVTQETIDAYDAWKAWTSQYGS